MEEGAAGYYFASQPLSCYSCYHSRHGEDCINIKKNNFNMDGDGICKTEENEKKLIPDQRTAYKAFLHAVESGEGGLYFLDSPGGTGKTFVTNLLLAKVRVNYSLC